MRHSSIAAASRDPGRASTTHGVRSLVAVLGVSAGVAAESLRSRCPNARLFLRALLAAGLTVACAGGEDADREVGAGVPPAGVPPAGETGRHGPDADGRGATSGDDVVAAMGERLSAAESRIDQLADSIDDLLHPVPLLTAAQELAFGRYGNADHLARAEALGIDPADPASAALVPLDSSGPYWIVRELDHSEPLVTPATRALLEEIGRRFQGRLEREGLPPYRFEISSALRTAESQVDLRRTNPNAAPGRSAHEYGTTIDITYAAFAAPLRPADDRGSAGVAGDAPAGEAPQEADSRGTPEWLEAHIARDESARLETVAARRSRELQAFLGEELLTLQTEGALHVMLERRQPVFHITLARETAAGG